MKTLFAIPLLLCLLGAPVWAQTTQEPVEVPYQSSTEEDLQGLETLILLGRKGLPIYRKIMRLQRELLTEVPGRDGQIHDFSDGHNGLQRFSREVQARSRGAQAGSEEDILWLEQVFLPVLEEAMASGAMRDVLELRDLAEEIDRSNR